MSQISSKRKERLLVAETGCLEMVRTMDRDDLVRWMIHMRIMGYSDQKDSLADQ